jgi:hypothetical protein
MDASAKLTDAPARAGWGGGSWLTRLLVLLTAGALILSALIRLTVAGRQQLWLDESWTLAVASLPTWGEVIRHTWLDANAPLYYAIMHLWGGVFGFSNAALRAPSIILGGLIPLPVLMATIPGMSQRTKLVWAILLALWVQGLWFSGDARGYALLALTCTAQTVAFVQMLDQPVVRRAAVWAALTSVAILTHYHGLVLGGLQGLAYLAMRREKAIRTWPAALIFLVPFGWLAIHAPRMVLFARPDVAWYNHVRWNQTGRILAFLVGTVDVARDIAIALGAGVFLAWVFPMRKHAKRLGPARFTPQIRALAAAALVAGIGALLVLGIGIVRPSFTTRYLTPFAPGILLGVAILFAWVARRAPYILIALVGVMAVHAWLWWQKELKVTGRVYNYEVSSNLLMRGNPERLVFLWDHPAHRIEPSDQLAAVGDAFFRRAGRPIETVAVHVGPREDPNPKLAQAAKGKRSAILWMYDRGVLGTAARYHPPNIEAFDPEMKCRNLGRGGIGILACDRYGSVLETR